MNNDRLTVLNQTFYIMVINIKNIMCGCDFS